MGILYNEYGDSRRTSEGIQSGFGVFIFKKFTVGSFCSTSWSHVLSQKLKPVSVCLVLELVPVVVKKIIKPRPQNSILVTLTGCFQSFRREPLFFLYGSPLAGRHCNESLFLKCNVLVVLLFVNFYL